MKRVETARVSAPALGFGTWELEDVYDNVRHALDVGYRHVDTAQVYDNEDEVGRAIADSDVDRSEVFVTTKVWRNNVDPAAVERSVEASLEALRTDHVELLLLHWPPTDPAVTAATLEAMMRLQERGLARAIGVSNFPSQLLRQALRVAPIAVDQVEEHAYLSIDAIRSVAADDEVAIGAYSPLARGALLGDPVLAEIAEAHAATPAQVAIAFLLAKPDTMVLPKASDRARIEENLAAQHLELTDDELARISGLARDERQLDPPWAPGWDIV